MTTMKTFVVEYESLGNLLNGEMVIHAPNLVYAQDRFIEWLKLQSQYQHLWNLRFKFREVTQCIFPRHVDND